MESISCVVLSTSFYHRQGPCLNTLQSIDRENKGLFCEKIISIDLVPRKPIGESLKNYIRENDWRLIASPLRKAMEAQTHLLHEVKSDWVFYSEDDVVITKIPDKSEWEWITQQRFDGLLPGMISYMHGGYEWGLKPDITSDVQNWKNYRLLHPDCVLWNRNPMLSSDFYWEFPTTIVRRSIFSACNSKASTSYPGVHSETALGNAWFNLGLHRHFYKATWMKDPTQFKGLEELTDEDVNGLFLHKCLHIKAFGNDAALRAIVPTNGKGMSF